MREAHPLAKRIAETLNLGDDEDLFGHDDARPAPMRAAASKGPVDNAEQEPSFGDALLGLLGSTTAGSTG